MGEVRPFPRDRRAENRIDLVDPGPAGSFAYPACPPPNDLEAEAVVLSAILISPAALTLVLGILKPEHFHNFDHARIFQAAQQLTIANTPVDVSTVNSWIRDRGWAAPDGAGSWAAFLAKIADETPSPGNVATHALTVFEKWQDRQFIATCQRMAAERYGDVGDRAAWYSAARAELGKITAPRPRLAGKPIGAAVEQAWNRVHAIQAGEVAGVSWGFGSLDALGMLGRKRQTILAGRPGMGKTALGFQVCTNVAQSPPGRYGMREAVYIASWEMPGDLLLFRAACIMAYVEFHKVERGDADADEQERIAGAMATLKKLPIVIDDQRCTTGELAARVKAHKELFESGRARDHEGDLLPKCNLGLVMVDYVQVGIADLGPRAQKRDVIGAVSKGLSVDVAKGCDVATLVLAMLKRVEAGPDGKVREPLLDDLKESGEIEEDADTVVLIHRPQYYLRRKCPAELRNVAFLIPGKGRYGMPDRTPRLGFAGGRFSDQLPAAARGAAHYDDHDDGGT